MAFFRPLMSFKTILRGAMYLSTQIPNPFVFPGRGLNCNQPLNPCEVTEHSALYVDVDGTGLAFAKFVEYTGGIDIKTSGCTSLVTGADGCGKTALLNRCAYHFEAQLEKDFGAVTIDLSREAQPSLPVEEKVQAAWSLILDHIDLLTGLLTPTDNAKVQSRGCDPTRGLDFLSKLLLSRKKCLIIILPAIELVKELKAYLSLQRKGVLLLCESSNPEVQQFLESNHGPAAKNPINLMTLGVLKAEDGWKFVSARLAGANGRWPDIGEDAICSFMETRMSNSGKTTIRELHVACKEVISHAIDTGKKEITVEDFGLYYLRAAAL